jgi:photosystem II stability/assembly factor-like uncharacterized protein
MKKIFHLIACFAVCLSGIAQNPWVATNSTTAGRYDDLSFINRDTGWVVSSSGKLMRTLNGGNTWNTQMTGPNYMRSVEFASAKLGFAGGLEYNGTNVFYRTTNGGATWTDISSVITASSRGICGICCVDTNYTYAVGIWSSPSYVMKTTDGGNTWLQIDMSAYANALIDVQFEDSLNGYVTGESNVGSEGGVILKTSDGGNTWTKVFTTNHTADYIWKIQRLDAAHWFASIEIGSTGVMNVLLKSSDGGNTWISKNVNFDNDHYQVVGFMDTLVGWIGGHYLYQTIDGGNNWALIDSLPLSTQYDRFKKVDSVTAYITRNRICKLQPNLIGVKENEPLIPITPTIKVFPNPSDGEVSLNLNVKQRTIYRLRIIDLAADKMVWEKIGEAISAGDYPFRVSKKLSPGTYCVYVMTNEGVDCKKLIVE